MNKGYIYKISCNITGEDYYGSTATSVKKRLYSHLCSMDCAATAILERGNYSYTQLEEVYYDDVKDLRKREKYYFVTYPNINKTSPYNTEEDKKRKKEELGKSQKALERKRRYYRENCEEIKKYQLAMYYKNREEILRRNSIPIPCECGSHYLYHHKNRHYKTKLHNKRFEEPLPLAPLFSEEFDAVLV